MFDKVRCPGNSAAVLFCVARFHAPIGDSVGAVAVIELVDVINANVGDGVVPDTPFHGVIVVRDCSRVIYVSSNWRLGNGVVFLAVIHSTDTCPGQVQRSLRRSLLLPTGCQHASP